ncbi:hypothetical protein Godav_024086 [Gossypium davidsonii]|uniref:Uncharacterized protein n=1 Tax=Gossypium davidsonii TaxID=34287 RepID=A0A7J8SVG8_GOSDV|nr:hypothetical protein [Gossypium davidsonii]
MMESDNLVAMNTISGQSEVGLNLVLIIENTSKELTYKGIIYSMLNEYNCRLYDSFK